jgi:hypothetical protein
MAAIGLVTGAIYEDDARNQVHRSFKTDGDRIFNEFAGLGVKWIRVQANWPNVSDNTYRDIVRKAHQKGIKVIVLLAGDQFALYRGSDSNSAEIDPFLTRYRDELNRLMTYVFNTPDTRPDALEIANEPNMNAPTPHGSRISPNAFAWLLRWVWDWKVQRGWPDIISGGTVNTYFRNESWWLQFFASSAWAGIYRKTRPFTYFGVHPYNDFSIDANAVQAGPPYRTDIFGGWKATTKDLLTGLSGKLDTVTGIANTRLFVTEFGWMMPNPALPGSTKWTYVPGKNCVMTLEQEAAGMVASMQAFNESNVVDAALWYSYRNDYAADTNEYQRYGLRRNYYPGSNHYPHKPGIWQQFRQLAGVAGTPPDPESYWR